MSLPEPTDATTLIRFDASKPGPRYRNLADAISDAIESDRLSGGQALPPQRQLAENLGVSVVTVRKAIELLAQDGRVVKKRGAGIFVSAEQDQLHKPLNVFNGFTEDTLARGMHPESRVLNAGIYNANAREVMALNLKPDESISRLCRLRMGDGEPLAYEISSFPTSVLPDPEQVTGSVYQVLTRRGLRPVRALQTISARNAGADVAAQLGIPVGQAVLYIERQGLLANNRPVEFTVSYYRSDKYDFVTELVAGPAAPADTGHS